jgi:DNA-binding SARP family transcriptional activator
MPLRAGRSYARTVLTLAVLGPVVVHRDGAEVRVPAGKTTELLVRLALDAGRLVRTTRLIEDLWPQSAVAVVPNTLQAKVSKLRRVLGDPHLVEGTASGYLLAVDPRDVDALEVLRLREEVTAQREAGKAEQVVRRGTAALALYGDEILPDAGDGDWIAPQRARFEEARLGLTEEILAARSELGESTSLVGELETLVTRYPFREHLWQLLITTLYRTGRQAEALNAYERIRQILDAELGLEPGTDLQALQQRILRQDPELDPHRRPRRSSVVDDDRGSPSGDLIGRGHDLSRLRQLVVDQRVVTVVGPAGVGKTRLVTELVHHERRGEIRLVRLEAAGTASAVWQSVGEALGVDAATEAMVLDRLRGWAMLLVLDNCEQVRDALVDPIGRILEASTTVSVLATSQRSLGIDGEVVYSLLGSSRAGVARAG